MTTTPIGEEDKNWNEKNRDKSIPIYSANEAKEIIDYKGLDMTRAERKQFEINRCTKLTNQRVQEMIAKGIPITQDILNKMLKEFSLDNLLPY